MMDRIPLQSVAAPEGQPSFLPDFVRGLPACSRKSRREAGQRQKEPFREESLDAV